MWNIGDILLSFKNYEQESKMQRQCTPCQKFTGKREGIFSRLGYPLHSVFCSVRKICSYTSFVQAEAANLCEPTPEVPVELGLDSVVLLSFNIGLTVLFFFCSSKNES